MQRYQLRQGKLRPHDNGEWVKAEDIKPLSAIVEVAWKLRTEAKDYNPCPDLGLRANYREHLHELLDQWKAAQAVEEENDE